MEPRSFVARRPGRSSFSPAPAFGLGDLLKDPPGDLGERELLGQWSAGAPLEAAPRRFALSVSRSFHGGFLPHRSNGFTLQNGATVQ